MASLHPAQTFASKEDGWKKLYNIYFGFEGCNISKEYAKTIVEGFNGKMVCIKKKIKPFIMLQHVLFQIIPLLFLI